MVYITGVLNCEITDNTVNFVSQEAFDFLMSFHSQVTAVNIITGNLNACKTNLLFIAGDGVAEDASDVDFFLFFSKFICRPLRNKSIHTSYTTVVRFGFYRGKVLINKETIGIKMQIHSFICVHQKPQYSKLISEVLGVPEMYVLPLLYF